MDHDNKVSYWTSKRKLKSRVDRHIADIEYYVANSQTHDHDTSNENYLGHEYTDSLENSSVNDSLFQYPELASTISQNETNTHNGQNNCINCQNPLCETENYYVMDIICPSNDGNDILYNCYSDSESDTDNNTLSFENLGESLGYWAVKKSYFLGCFVRNFRHS